MENIKISDYYRTEGEFMIKIVNIGLLILLINQFFLILILWRTLKKQELEIRLLKEIIKIK